GIVAYVRDDAVLDVHRLAECRHRTVELAACPCDALVAGEASVEAVWKQLAIALVELIDAEADALRLAHQPVDLLETPLKLSELRKVDAREVPRLVDEHLRLVLERLYLIVDLLERARGGEQVLRVVGGIEHDAAELGMHRRARHPGAHDERAGGAKAEPCGHHVLLHVMSPTGSWAGEIRPAGRRPSRGRPGRGTAR